MNFYFFNINTIYNIFQQSQCRLQRMKQKEQQE
jgi:hypothetical protein